MERNSFRKHPVRYANSFFALAAGFAAWGGPPALRRRSCPSALTQAGADFAGAFCSTTMIEDRAFDVVDLSKQIAKAATAGPVRVLPAPNLSKQTNRGRHAP